MNTALLGQYFYPRAQRLVDQRAQCVAAFGFGGLNDPLAQRGRRVIRGIQAVWHGLEGFQPLSGQDGVFKTESMGFARDVAGIDQPVQTSVTELGLVGQKPAHLVDNPVLVDEHCGLNGDRQWKRLVEVGECLAHDFIKPLDIGDRHGKTHL